MNNSFTYRLKLAVGFWREAQQDIDLERWRSVMDNAQLAVENVAKGVLALLGPVGRTHQPAPLLREAIQQQQFPASERDPVERLAEIAETLGVDIHIQTDYGDETGNLTPWELFSEDDARQALLLADEAVALAQTIGQSLAPDEEA